MRRGALYMGMLALGAAATLTSAQARAQSAEDEPEEHEQAQADAAPAAYVATTKTAPSGAFERRPDRIESIGAEQLKRRGATDLAQALEVLGAGVAVSPTNTSSALQIDGLNSAQLTVLRDGIQIARQTNSPNGPIVDLSSIGIDPESVERIDIYRGLGPLGSAGVVIDIITRAARPKQRLSLSSQWLSAPEAPLGRQTYALLGQASPLNSLVARVGGQLDDLSAFDVNQDATPDSPERQRYQASAELSYLRSRNEHLELSYNYVQQHTASIGGPNAPLDDLVEQDRHELKLQGRWWLTADLRLSHHTQARLERYDFSKRVRSSGFVRPKGLTTQQTLSQDVQGTIFLAKHELELFMRAEGMELERSGESGEIEPARLGAANVGLSDLWVPHQAVQLSAKALGQVHSRFGANAQGQLGALWTLNEQVALRSQLSSTLRLPTAEELFLDFDHSEVGYKVIGNNALKPEALKSAQLGLILKPHQSVQLEASAFYHHLSQSIVIGAEANNAQTFTYVNGGPAHTAGLNASMRVESKDKRTSFNLRYHALPLAQTIEDRQRLTLRPTHAGFMEVRRAWLDGRLETWVDLQARVAMDSPQAGEQVPAQALLGAGTSFKLQRFAQVRLDLNNLLDQTDPTWGPTPGLHALLSINLQVED